MVEQILPNNNQKCYSNFSPKFSHLNTAWMHGDRNGRAKRISGRLRWCGVARAASGTPCGINVSPKEKQSPTTVSRLTWSIRIEPVMIGSTTARLWSSLPRRGSRPNVRRTVFSFQVRQYYSAKRDGNKGRFSLQYTPSVGPSHNGNRYEMCVCQTFSTLTRFVENTYNIYISK
jgi:hypothetical protein